MLFYLLYSIILGAVANFPKLSVGFACVSVRASRIIRCVFVLVEFSFGENIMYQAVLDSLYLSLVPKNTNAGLKNLG
jgi:hypothetical protein